MKVAIEQAGQKEPFCPHYAVCGGCSLQHLDLAAYRDLKIARLKQILSAAGLETEVLPLQSAAQDSRRRTTFVAKKFKTGELKLGYHPAQSHEITDIQNCPILVPALQAFIAPLRGVLMQVQFKQADIALTLTEAGIDMQWLGELAAKQKDILAQLAEGLPQVCRVAVNDTAIYTRNTPYITFGKTKVNLPVGAFLQASSEGEVLLRNAVLGLCDGTRVADLFSGLGTFGLPLVEQGKQVLAVDNAVESLKALRLTGQVKVMERDLFKQPLSAAELNDFDSVVIDPPRAGAKAQVAALAKSQTKQVIYVSCNPVTFAQDAQLLIAGGYKLNSVQPVDQFVWSSHLEIVAAFSRA